jgi:hypothetical protein
MVVGCRNAIDETVCGSGYCVEHEHHPVGNASFEVVRQVLIDFRESTGYAGWDEDKKEGWDKLETYTKMEELGETFDDYESYERNDGSCGVGGVHGVRVKDGKLFGIELGHCNLTGTSHPLSARTLLPRKLAHMTAHAD